ncbi:glucose 1-dehydrogenase [bacterium]|nr:glucose 1-dehydrogenase [bacterium]
MARLEGKVAIVTGGASGIGRAIVDRFVEEGAKVSIWDVNEEAGNAAASELGDKVEFRKVNTADAAGVQAAVNGVVEKWGGVDVLANNAGITRDATLMKMTEEQFDQVIDVNLKGVFLCGQAAAKQMVAQGSGSIISTSSVVALYGNFGQTNYVATKTAVMGMTKVWARELGRKGVRANAIAPGFIATEMVKKMPEKVLDMMRDKTPLGRLGEPVDIANAFVFLASDESSFVNGTTLSVDGGIVL